MPSETIVRLFYKHNTIDYRLLSGNTQSDYKDHKLNAVTWNNLYCKGISAIWEGNQSILHRHFLRFRQRIRFICERSAENETLQFDGRYGFGSVLVYMWNGLYTINSEIFARILFSQLTLKHIFVTLKIRDKGVIYQYQLTTEWFANSWGFYFHETPHMRRFAKIKPMRKFPNLQYSNALLFFISLIFIGL